MKRSRLMHAALFGMLAATAGCGQPQPTMPVAVPAAATSETAEVKSHPSAQFEVQQWGWRRRWTTDRWRRRWTNRWGRRWTTDGWRRRRWTNRWGQPW